MADRRRDVAGPRPHGELSHRAVSNRSGWGDYHRASPLTASALTASAQMLPHSENRYAATALQYASWQEEAWDYYVSLGEFNYGVEWFAEALSRVRLVAAELAPGGDEPTPLDSGPAVDLVESLAGGTAAQAQLLRSIAIQLAVVGECYFVGREVTDLELFGDTTLDAEPDEDGRIWTIQPVNTLRRSPKTIKTAFQSRKRRGWQLQTDEVTWIDLPRESLVTRVWDRNEHFPWLAMSPARAALATMREIDMYNRYIMATLISRVALNGLLLIPDEVTLPVNPEYEEATEPFMAELIDVMRSAIKNPGAPSSAAPVPLRVPGEQVANFKHLTFATPLDEKIFQAREEALKRLASSLNLPQEVLTGMGGTSHWNAWQITEDAIKIHIAPKVEIITNCLTRGFFYPMMRSLGEPVRTKNGGLLVIWYDTSTLTQRPDRSDLALKLNELIVINDAATRRETGFSEEDAPSKNEIEEMALKRLAVNPVTYSVALKELTGLELAPPPAPAGGMMPDGSGPGSGPNGSEPSDIGNEPNRETPNTRKKSPPPPNADASGSGDDVTASASAGDRRAELVRRVRAAGTGPAQVSALATLVAHDHANGTLPVTVRESITGRSAR